MKKTLCILLSLALSLSMLAGCGAGSSAAASSAATPASSTDAGDTGDTGAEQPAFDISERVELRMYALGNTPNDEELAKQFWDQLNEILLEKLNCTIKYEYAEGYHPQSSYDLALSAGEPYDIIQASGGLNYKPNAMKGAFLDITDMVPVYAPDLYALIPEESWEQVLVDGRAYDIPRIFTTYHSNSVMYREDLRKKYDLEPLTDMDSIEAYLQAIKDNEPGMLPSDDNSNGFFRRMFLPSTVYRQVDDINGNTNFVIDPSDPRKVSTIYETPEFLPFCEKAKDFADRGFWSSSVLSSSDWGPNSVVNGKAALAFSQIFPWYSWHPPYIESQHPGWEVKMFDAVCLNDNSFLAQEAATENMFAVARTAANPERALMVINLIQTDEEVWRLCRYGIEGVNYTLTDDGKIDTTWVDQETGLFNYFPTDLVENDHFNLTPVDQWVDYDYHMDILNSRAQPDPLVGFAIDLTNIEPTYVAVNQVREEYALALEAGLVDDVEAAYNDLLERMKAAGIEECRAEIERQINEFLDAKGK